MGGGSTRLRTRIVWLIVLPFLLFARPAPAPLAWGGLLAAIGLGLRAWSAGTIRKREALTTSGPYAFVRNPLYIGSFLIGTGLSLGGGHWPWVVLFVGFFIAVYAPTIAAEEEHLTQVFGHGYVEYAAKVPAFLPRLTPYRAGGSTPGFAWGTYARYREWEALLGATAAWVFLAAKMWLQR
jgi:protein-S-isoprenylcysteine O-methyltransferase Ste14